MRKQTGILIVIVLAVLAWSRRSHAAPPSAAPAEREREPMNDLEATARAVLERYGRTLAEFAGPLPPGPMAVLIAHESGGRPWAITAGTATMSGREAGLVMSTPEEARTTDTMPFDPRSTLWGAQARFQRTIARLDEKLRLHGTQFVLLSLEDRCRFLVLTRAIGTGATRAILSRSVEAEGATPWAKAVAWVNSPAGATASESYGRQNVELIRKRFRHVDRIVSIGLRLVPSPVRLESLAARPADLAKMPTDYVERIEAYQQAAKAAGYRATGPLGG